jgi:GTP-binding protein
MDFGDGAPEICFLGRSNVGKSSILNALFGKRLAHTSAKPGRTRLMNAFSVGGQDGGGKNRLVVMDMPGYGHGGRAEWGTQIIKYFEKRAELKRAILLVDAEHGLKLSDTQLLKVLKEHEVPFQVVLSKADKIIFDGNRNPSPEVLEQRLAQLRDTMEGIKEAVQPDTEENEGGVGEVIACSAMKWVHGEKMNINAVRFAMLQAAGLEYRPVVAAPKPLDIVSHEELFGA